MGTLGRKGKPAFIFLRLFFLLCVSPSVLACYVCVRSDDRSRPTARCPAAAFLLPIHPCRSVSLSPSSHSPTTARCRLSVSSRYPHARPPARPFVPAQRVARHHVMAIQAVVPRSFLLRPIRCGDGRSGRLAARKANAREDRIGAWLLASDSATGTVIQYIRNERTNERGGTRDCSVPACIHLSWKYRSPCCS